MSGKPGTQPAYLGQGEPTPEDYDVGVVPNVRGASFSPVSVPWGWIRSCTSRRFKMGFLVELEDR